MSDIGLTYEVLGWIGWWAGKKKNLAWDLDLSPFPGQQKAILFQAILSFFCFSLEMVEIQVDLLALLLHYPE